MLFPPGQHKLWNDTFNTGLALEMDQQYDAAVQQYQLASDAACDKIQRVRCRVGIANCMRHQGRHAENLTCLKEAMSLDPGWPQTRFLLSAACVRSNDIEAAVDHLFAGYATSMSCSAADTQDFVDAYMVLPEHKVVTRTSGAASLLDLLYSERVSENHIKLLHEVECHRVRAALGPSPFDWGPPGGVCFVSEHFRTCSVTFNFLPLLKHLLNSATEPYHLWFVGDRTDEMTQTYRSLPGVRFWTERPPNMRVAVCLDGHTGTSTALHALTHRLADLQVDYLGYPFSTGHVEMDVKVGDAYADTPGAEKHYTERLVKLSPSMWTWQAVCPVDIHDLPSPECSGRILVCQNFKKVRPSFLRAVKGILAKNSRLTCWFKCTLRGDADAVFKSWILPAMGEHAGRVGMAPWSDPSSITHDLARYDFALDTWPYNGTVTTMEALYAGLPVLTLPGNTHRSRVTASLLTSAGLTDLVADSEHSYTEKAGELASAGPVRLTDIHTRVATCFRSCPVMTVAEVADAFRECVLGADTVA